MDYDNIIPRISGFGREQRRIYFLLYFPAIFGTVHVMAGVFLAARPDFRCLLPHETSENAKYQLEPNISNLAYPWDNKTNSWSRCERYDVDFTDRYYEIGGNLSLNIPTVKCESFVYDKTTYKLTTTTEFNLVCDDAWLRVAADSILLFGSIIGATIFGSLSDKYGRRPIFCLTIVLNLVSGLLASVSPEIITYMMSRSIVGLSANGMFLIAYVTVIEMVSPERRLIAGIGMELSSSLGYMVIAGSAYFIPHWRIMQIAITLPSLMFLVCWWFVPESIRWLLTKGRLEEAKDLLLKVSSKNGVEITRDTLDGMLRKNRESKSDIKESSIFDLLKYPNLRRKTLLLFFTRFVITCTYLGLSWNTSNLGGNDYVNIVISGLVEIPAHIFVSVTLNKWGRRIILFSCLMLAGTSLLLTTIIQSDKPWLLILLTMLGKSAITASFTIINIFTAELYPTVIRSVGVGVCSTFSQIGGIISPSIIHLSTIWKPLPLVIFGSGSLIAGFPALLLPETFNKKLPDSIEDGEQFGEYAFDSYLITSVCIVLVWTKTGQVYYPFVSDENSDSVEGVRPPVIL